MFPSTGDGMVSLFSEVRCAGDKKLTGKPAARGAGISVRVRHARKKKRKNYGFISGSPESRFMPEGAGGAGCTTGTQS